MNERSINKTRKITVRFGPEEFDQVESRYKKTTFRKLSEYVRATLLNKPQMVTYRDRSMDELLEELILLRRELNAVGNNFNQAVHKLNAAQDLPEAKFWLSMISTLRDNLEPQVGAIKERITQFSEQWSQKLSVAKASSVH
ncbi:plasmid mobilization relaxosome protein MobC [Daejeonella sp. JGW-45]|uniref:plasmid mobilization protein n=1 Tax=Daejeonella sp. JGW-45 TaxID=3034148 RepID=UPI0023ED4FF2|nr:plasmid mobilization relaxosome protein MobC [Daejeonella sp. JGW-45]